MLKKNFKNNIVRPALFVFFAVGIYFFGAGFCPAAKAAGVVSEVKLFNAKSLISEKRFDIQFAGLDEAPSLATLDLGGDGISELVVGASEGQKPEVKIYREDGSLVNSFLVYEEDFWGGVNVAAGDLDGDGKSEIVIAPAGGRAAEIKIFDGYGRPKVSEDFLAFDKTLENGASVAVKDINNDGKDEIIVGSGPGQDPEIKIFNAAGEVLSDFKVVDINKWSGLRVAAGDVNGDGSEEILAAPGLGSLPEVQIFKTDGTLINKFLAYDKSFKGGVNLATGDLAGDGRDLIIAGAGFTGGPHVRIFDGNGNLKNQFFSFDKNSRNGALIAVGNFSSGKNEIVSMPANTGPSGRQDLYKYIEIDISDQSLKIFQNGFNLGKYITSTGTVALPTPLGTFKIMSKSELAYSRAYSLYMPNFMQFTAQGAGIHGLPFWKYANGKIVYEGASHLGKRVSHGCVRLALDAAMRVFAWADVGTPVIVHQ